MSAPDAGLPPTVPLEMFEPVPRPSPWRTLEAGRELDALVAERVLGCRVKRDPHGNLYCGDGVTCAYPHALGERDDQMHGDLAPFSTDMNAAWMVVDAVTARGTDLNLQHLSDRSDYEWRACFMQRPSTHNTHPSKLGTSAAHAICRAALATVGA